VVCLAGCLRRSRCRHTMSGLRWPAKIRHQAHHTQHHRTHPLPEPFTSHSFTSLALYLQAPKPQLHANHAIFHHSFYPTYKTCNRQPLSSTDVSLLAVLPTPLPSNTSAPNPTAAPAESGLSKGATTAIIAGVIAAVVIAAAAGLFLFVRRRLDRRRNPAPNSHNTPRPGFLGPLLSLFRKPGVKRGGGTGTRGFVQVRGNGSGDLVPGHEDPHKDPYKVGVGGKSFDRGGGRGGGGAYVHELDAQWRGAEMYTDANSNTFRRGELDGAGMARTELDGKGHPYGDPYGDGQRYGDMGRV
jgi:hypothetical protein